MAESDGVAKKVAEAAAGAVAGKTTEKVYEGIIEGLTEVAIRDGIPAVVRYARGRGAVRPGDEDKLTEALKMYKEGKKGEAVTHFRIHLSHWLAAWTFNDEFILNEDGFLAVRQGLLTNAQRITLLALLAGLPPLMRQRLREIHVRQQDPDIRASNFAEMATMTDAELRTHIRGNGLMDPQPLDAIARAARLSNRRLDREFADLQNEFRQPVRLRDTIRNLFRLW